jgi:hypothetical protein
MYNLIIKRYREKGNEKVEEDNFELILLTS